MATARQRVLDPCPDCGCDEVLKVTVLVVGEPMSMLVCSRCEWRSWSSNGVSISLDRILSRIREDRGAKAS
jgi:hypothetical protein